MMIPIILCVMVLAGMLFAFAPKTYYHDITLDVDGNELHYSYHSSIGAPTSTVVFSSTGDFFIEEVVLLMDDSYASLTSRFLQEEMAEDLHKQLKLRGIGFTCCDSEEMLEVIRSSNPSRTALMFASGALPVPLYDGTADCPLMYWLDRGGIVINESGCLGKYISYGSDPLDIQIVTGYGMLFAGSPDSVFNDLQKRTYASGGYDPDVRDSLQFYMNEVTYGVDISGMRNAKNLGYVSEDGYSAASIFESRGGMVINFGVSIKNHSHFDHFVAQIMASGIDYSSELLYFCQGDTRFDSSGTVELGEGIVVAYCFIGLPRAVYGERILIVS